MEEPRAISATGGWLFLTADSIPTRWRARARDVVFVPLLPSEAIRILADDPVVPAVAPQDEELLTLVARGLSTEAIAEVMSLHPRTVHRRLVRVRERLGVASKEELALLLAGRGF